MERGGQKQGVFRVKSEGLGITGGTRGSKARSFKDEVRGIELR